MCTLCFETFDLLNEELALFFVEYVHLPLIVDFMNIEITFIGFVLIHSAMNIRGGHSLIGETLGLVPISRLNCPRLLVSSPSCVKISTWYYLGLVSLCLKGRVSSRLSLAFIFEEKSCPGLVSVAISWSRHLKKIKH